MLVSRVRVSRFISYHYAYMHSILFHTYSQHAYTQHTAAACELGRSSGQCLRMFVLSRNFTFVNMHVHSFLHDQGYM